jgi:hypothetical protein
MAGKQIKHILIKTQSLGGKEAQKELKELDVTMQEINKSITSFSRRSATLGSALTTLAKKSNTVSKNLRGVGDTLKAINAASAGTAGQTKKLDGYITNLEVLGSVLKDVAVSAERAELGLDGINATAGMKSLVSILEQIQVNTGKAAGRIKEVRENVSQLDVTTGRAGEELEDMSYQARKAAAATEVLGKSSKQTRASMRQTTKAAKNQTKSFSDLAFGSNPLVSTYAAIAVNIYAVSAAFRLLSEAASFERLKTQTASFSSAVSGINVKRLAAEMQEASAGALNLKESLKFATKGVAFDFGADELERLTIGARKASIALGIDFTDAMDRVLRGISKQEIELFDELGVVTRLTTAFENYAPTIGKTVEELTAYERQAALTIEVQRQLDTRFSGIKLDTTGWEKLGVAVSNFTTKSLGSLSKALDPVADKLAILFTALTSVPTAADYAAESVKIFNDALKNENVIQAAVAMEEYADLIDKVSTANAAALGPSNDIRKAREEQVEVVEDLTYAVLALSAALGFLFRTALTGAFVTAIGTVTAVLGTLTVAFTTAAAVVGVGSAIVGGLLLMTGVGAALAAVFFAISSAVSYFADSVVEPIVDGTESAKEMNVELQKMRENLKLDFDPMAKGFNPAAALKWTKSITAASGSIAKLQTGLKDTKSPIEEMALAFGEIGNTPKGLSETTKAVEDQKELLQRYKDQGLIPEYVKDFNEIKEVFLGVSAASKDFSKNFANSLKLMDVKTSGKVDAKMNLLNLEIQGKTAELQRQSGAAAGAFSSEKREQLANELLILNATRDRLEVDQRLGYVLAANANSLQLGLDSISLYSPKQSELLEMKLKSLNTEIAATKEVGLITDALNNQLAVLENKLRVQKEIEKRTIVENAMAATSAFEVEILKQKGTLETEILDTLIKQAKARSMMLRSTGFTEDANALDIEILAMKRKQQLAQTSEDMKRSSNALIIEGARLQASLADKGSEQARVAVEQQILDVKIQQAKAIGDVIERTKQLTLLGIEQTALDNKTDAAPLRDASSTLDSMAGLQGVSDLQSATLGIASTFTDAFAGAAEAGMDGFSGFTEFLSGNMEAFQDVAQGVADGIGSVYQASSDARVAGIDLEIAAEKKRDGKSAESLAKIKALEKKKIKEQAKAKKAQVVISTATAIAMSFAELGPIAGIAPAIAMAGMGVIQLAAINKAANGQIAGLDAGGGGGSEMKIESGSRKNDIDVSRNANAGELSFINGGQGQGTASSFNTPGRAGGGTSGGGASITVGERGAEEITPLVPVNVAPAGSSSGGGNLTFSPVFNVEALDSAGFEAVTSRFSVELFNSLEKEMRARNLSLDNLA